jgi:hypothetical protein
MLPIQAGRQQEFVAVEIRALLLEFGEVLDRF